MSEQDVKQLKKSVNYRFGAVTIDALAELVKRWSCKPTAAVERAILEALVNGGTGTVKEPGESTLEGEAGTIARWWMRQDGITEREVIEAAVLVYDKFRENGAFSRVPSTLAVPDESASIAARAAAAVKAAREREASQDEPVTEAADVPGVHRGIDNLPKNAQCRHCGEKFAGPKRAIVCPDCKAAGHADDPHGCGECFNRDGPG